MIQARPPVVVIPYDERPQFVAYHDRKERWACIVAHRRAGKTVACVNELIKGALTCPLPSPRFAYIAPYFSQAKDVAWNYLRHYSLVVSGATANESELRVDFPGGGRVRLYGSDNYDRLRGLSLDGVVFDEPADMDPRVWPDVIRPALSDRVGWATWIGTPRGHNHFYEIAHGGSGMIGAEKDPDWFFLELKASETHIISEAELADARRQMPPDVYDQEYECSFEAAIRGAVYADEMKRAKAQGRICPVAWDRYADVHTAWDLGYEDATAIIFFQLIGQEVHVIDYYETNHMGLDHYVSVLREKPYHYGTHYFPHDVKAHELAAGRTREETLKSMGVVPKDVPNVPREDGINALRRLFDRLWFDADRCKVLVEALTLYHREFDEARKTFKQAPEHDWTSHPADAARYMALGIPGRAPVIQDRYKKGRKGPARPRSFMSA